MTFLDRAEQFLRYAGPVLQEVDRRVSGALNRDGGDRGQREAGPPAGDAPPDGVPPELLLRALPDVARTAAAVFWRTSRWTLEAALRAGNIAIQGTVSGESADAVAVAVLGEVRQSLLRVAGVGAWAGDGGWTGQQMTLAERMNALLDASANVGVAQEGHPAYTRLLSELTPDEARILRLFAERGPQPAVDVRTRKLLGAGSRLVASGLTMIARYAGCHNAARVPGYLDNMARLGLIRFSDDALSDHRAYDVLEAQQEVKDAMTRAGRGMTVRRSIELTVFGRNLCAMTGLLPPDPTATGQAGGRPAGAEIRSGPASPGGRPPGPPG